MSYSESIVVEVSAEKILARHDEVSKLVKEMNPEEIVMLLARESILKELATVGIMKLAACLCDADRPEDVVSASLALAKTASKIDTILSLLMPKSEG